MSWKVYNIKSGKILKANFGTEDEAKDWLDSKPNLDADDFEIEEMDAEEEESWLEEQEEAEEKEELDEDFTLDDDDDDYMDPDAGILGEGEFSEVDDDSDDDY